MCDDELPFNPFYIGPHPSQACAATATPPRQCCPDHTDEPVEDIDCNAKPKDELVVATIEVTVTPQPICRPYPCNQADRE